ncbi:hypothetical protein [Micromonospora fulviviridis]|uniref:Uncharacterized protein n=1 Tax=Micromonospora fulviviridis TaxID=47860 RepID=A0ABV2VKH6_9ACTN
MNRRSLLVTVVAVVGVVLLAACGGVFWLARADGGQERDCAAQVAAEEAKVRTDRRWTAQDVPGIGEYAEIHWQVDHPSSACSRAPGPTDSTYQGVVRLAPADAHALAAAYDWAPVTDFPPPLAVWPGLSAYVPPEVRWRRSPAYDAGARASVQFDPDRALLLFTAAD